MHDILLRNALIADPEADSLRTGDVAVEGGCIVEAIGSACTTIDCSGLVLQPGIIDTHVHLGINPLSYGMVARAGVTTALDMSGPIEKLLDEFSCANVGINVAALNAILPGRNISGNNPDREQLRNFINLSRRSGALGVKLLGGHFPLTPEASHRMVETADDSHCYMAWHVGTTEKGSDIEGLLEAAEIAAGHPLHLPHVNAYCRGRVRPVLEECSIAEKVILEHPEFTTESYLSARNGAPLDCDAAGKPHSAITAGTLTRFGFESSASGIEAAIRAGRLAVLFPNQSEITLLTGTDAVAYLRAHREHCDGSFDGVNPLESRVFFASQKRPDRTFLVDAISTDGGGIPRNVILQNGLSLVELGALTTIEFARKTSLLPAQMLGLKNKGRLLAGMDADLTIYDPTSHQAVYTIVNGRFVLLNRVLQTGTGTLLTTYEGTQAAQNRGLKTQVVSGIVPFLHRSL